MRAVKDNREYTIVQSEKQRYADKGFDIYNDDGELVISGKGKTVSLEDYEKLKKELEEARAAGEGADNESLFPILKEYAQMKQIDTGNTRTVKGILDRIRQAGERGNA